MDTQVLLVDDEPGVLDVMRAHLTDKGYDCTLETSPLKALEQLRSHPYGLLITDLRMPEMSGLEVVRKAKEIDPDISIVVVTGMIEVEAAIDAMRAGADDYVIKPFNLGDIGLAARRALEKRTLNLQSRLYQERLESRLYNAAEDIERLNSELANTKQYLEKLLHSTVDAIFSVDSTDRVEFANGGAERMLGYAKEELYRCDAAKLYSGGSDEVSYIRRKLRDDPTVQDYETELIRQNGTRVPVNVSLSQVDAVDGQASSILAICKDITRQKQLELELKELSIKDSLTGLYNQRYFYERLHDEIERARRQGHPLSLLLFDVDNFKTFNDGRGHLEGDRVLQTVGRTVLQSTRGHVDLGFRYGGDEFTVILPEADEDVAYSIADRIRRSFESKQFERLSLSMGIMSYREDLNAKAFIHGADNMMYEAKRAGGNRVRIFQSSSDVTATTEETSST